MMTFKSVSSADQAADYFESADDYYAGEGDGDADSGIDGVSELAEEAVLEARGAATAAEGSPELEPKASKGKISDGKSTRGHKGVWNGTGAEDLGLRGAVDRELFKQLLNGRLPDGTVVRKGKTKDSKDRKAIDFTLSAPKSVSIQALVRGDKRIVEAHDKAVVASLKELEGFAMARKKVKGLSYRENTKKLVIASFRHELSRAQDPQLHTHNLVMNMTRRADGEWRALSNEDMLKNVKVVGAFYRAHLAKQLREMGYQLRETRKGGWELANVSDKAIDLFSSRSKDIERLLKARGQDRDTATTAQKQILTLASRPKKTDADRAWLRQYWNDMARDANIDFGPEDISFRAAIVKKVGAMAERVRERLSGVKKSALAADGAIDFAIEHLREREGIFTKSEVLEVAYGRAATRSDTTEVDAALERAKADGRLVRELPLYQTARSLNRSAADLVEDPASSAFKLHDDYEKLTRTSWVALTMQARGLTQQEAEDSVAKAIERGALVPAEERYTTAAARATEIRILAIERDGRGAVMPLASEEHTRERLADLPLNDGQRDAVLMVLTSPDRFNGIQGLAGTGKSHALRPMIDAITKEAAQLAMDEGYKIVGLAPYASQNQALEELGVPSQTVASFLVRKSQHQQLDTKTIVFLDESSVLAAKPMEELMRLVESRGARMILIGDRKQTAAVEAGKPFAQLQDVGMRTAYLTEIQRQQDETLKTAVIHAANDRIRSAVDILRDHTVQISEPEARHDAIAADFAALSMEERDRTLVVSGTNDARRAINERIRHHLGISHLGEDLRILEQVDLTKAEIKSAASYGIGQVVVPEAGYRSGLKKGEQYEVVDVDVERSRIHLRDLQGNVLSIDPSQHPTVTVSHRASIKIAVGEDVVMTRADKGLGIRRGDRYRVAAIDEDHVSFRNARGKTVEFSRKKDLHIRYAYVSTVHSGQGLTSNRVLIDANTKSLTANKAVFYVAISRPRRDLKIYTDSRAQLAKAMSREPKKFAALELRDERGEAFFLQGRVDSAARAKLAAAIRRSESGNDRRPPTLRPRP